MSGRDHIAAIHEAGFRLATGVFDSRQLSDLIAAIERSVADDARHGVRNLLDRMPELRLLVKPGPIARFVTDILGDGARFVRAILFDKTPETNWKVAFHQDRTIAIQRRADVPGFGPWSVKAGIPHVQPPLNILESMLTARVHLDDCGLTNGPLRVSPGSHRLGILDDTQIKRLRDSAIPIVARAGDVLYMRPLLLHASSAAESPSHRRVIHLEFAGTSLPDGLDWHESDA